MEGNEVKYFHRVQDYRTVFGSPEGKRVLEDLRKSYKQTFDPNPSVSAYKQGKRDVVLDIERLIELAQDPEFTLENIKDYFAVSGEEESNNG